MAKFATLVDIYTDAIKTFPDNPIFGTKRQGSWSWLTYREFGRRTDAFRAGLSELGFARGDRIAIIANNRVEWAVAAYACFGLGVAFVPMYEAQNPKEWEFIIKDCEAKGVIVATDAIAEKVKPLLESVSSLKYVISMDTATKAEGKVKSFKDLEKTEKKVPCIKPEVKDTACFIYTSGTTGSPK